MKKVLIFTYLQRHLKKMVPIIKDLEKNNEIELTILLMTNEEKELAQKNHLIYIMLDTFTSKKRTSDFDLAWGLEPLINAIDKIQPDLFLSIEVNYILRNAVRHCKQNGIPSLVVQHGTPNQYSLHAFMPFEADCFAAWGDFAKDFLVANGVAESKIVLTGGVPFDRTSDLRPNRQQIAQALGLDPDKKWIVFTTQAVGPGNCPSEEEIITGVTEVARQLAEHEDYQLIFQIHPSQPLDDVVNILSPLNAFNSFVARYKDTEELMAASEGVITFFSTTAIDAILMEKPLLLINLTEDKDFLPFVKLGAAFGAYTGEEIGVAIEKLLAENDQLKPNYSKAQQYVNYMNDGRALERVLELCYRMLNI